MSRSSDGELNFGQKVVGGLIGAISNTNSSYAVHNASVHAEPTEPHFAELLAGVRQLRDDLQRLVPSPETDALDEVLASVEDEITATGHASPGQLARLHQALQDAGAVAGLLASAAAVEHALATLLGG
ncbi:hypothetical protein ACIQ6Y_20180 [Streptomyces sp. NPDC096205]|uniref:hypothetical protein n=1 Tax=Streptomyces sp. NPDC096205 TaxID=3366081 RepID=UPI003825872E